MILRVRTNSYILWVLCLFLSQRRYLNHSSSVCVYYDTVTCFKHQEQLLVRELLPCPSITREQGTYLMNKVLRAEGKPSSRCSWWGALLLARVRWEGLKPLSCVYKLRSKTGLWLLVVGCRKPSVLSYLADRYEMYIILLKQLLAGKLSKLISQISKNESLSLRKRPWDRVVRGELADVRQ